MRKGRLLISGMIGFWLWLAGMPVNHDTAGQWLAGELPRAHADIASGVIDTDTTVPAGTTVSSDITVKNGFTLTLSGSFGNVTTQSDYTVTNNGTIQSNGSVMTHLGYVNNGSIINGSASQSAIIQTGYGTVVNKGTVTNVNGQINIRGWGSGENYGTMTNSGSGSKFDIGGTASSFFNRSGGRIVNNQGADRFELTGTFTNDSGATIENSAIMNISLCTLNNSGTVTNYAGGVLNNDSVINNLAGGLLTNNGTLICTYGYAKLTNSGTLENYGLLQFNATVDSGTWSFGNLDNYGTLTNAAGATVVNHARSTNYAGATIINYGTFNAALPTVNGTQSTVGTFTNNGAFENYRTFNSGGYTINNGTFKNDGTITGGIENNGTLTNSGTLDGVQNGAQALTGGVPKPTTAVLKNGGTLSAFSNFGTLTNYASGVITLLGATDNYSGVVTNDGRIVSSGNFKNSYDHSTGDNPVVNPLRSATLTNNSSFTNNAGATFENMAGATFNNNGTLFNYGGFANKAETVWGVPTPGAVTNTGAIYNYGWMTNQDGSSFTSSGAIYNYGTFTNTAGSTFNVTGGTVYGPILNYGTFNVSGGSFILPAAGQRLSITNLSGSAAFSVAAVTAAGAPVTVTASAAGSHTLTVTGSGAATGTAKAVDLPAASTATFTGGGDVGAYYCTLAKGSALGLDAEDYYFASTGQPSAISKAAMGTAGSTTTVWYGEMNEIRKRMGELRMGGQSAGDFWARTYASRFTVRPAGADSYRQSMHGLEIGKDNPQPFAGGRKYTGFLAGYGAADNTYAGGASGTTDSTYLGTYASWLRDDGAYVDLVGKYNWFNPRFTTASDSGKYTSTGLGLSAEIGKRFERGNGVFVEPAAELSAMWANRASYTTANGLAVEVPAARSLQLRLGVTAGRKWQDADGASRQFYGKVSWVNEYQGDSTTRVDGAAFDASLKGHQWVTGIGFVEDNDKRQLYIDAEKSWGRAVSKEWGLNAGCRWKF